MPTSITIGYGDSAGYEQTDAAIRNAAHEHDATLRERGVIMGIAAEPTQVRNHDGVEVLTKKGPFLQSALPIAGFAIVEAENIEEAIKLVSQTPCAVAQSLVELWPLQTTI